MIRLFLERTAGQRGVWALPVAAFAVTSAIAFMVIGGAQFFTTIDSEFRVLYLVLSGLALVLLVVPMTALMSSSARLLAQRRDDRLSTLRLLGATTSQLRGLAVVESALIAAAGVVLGMLLYSVLMPVVGVIPFGGAPMGAGGLWIGPAWLLASAGAVLLVAVLSALAGMRRIQITPLGVRTREVPATVHWIRILAAAGLIVAALVLIVVRTEQSSLAIALAMAVAAVVIPLIGVQFLGPWVLKIVTRIRCRRAKTAERLIAARSVLESPQQMWRQVGGVALTAYVGVIAGAGLGMFSSQAGADAAEQILIGDIRRGVLLTLGVSFLMVACSVGINQSAQILDRAEIYRTMVRMGMSAQQLHRVRRHAVMGALGTVVVIAVAIAGVTAAPLVGVAIIVNPVNALVVAAVFLAGVLIVRAGLALTRPTLDRAALTG